jgi:nucleoside phosphorylase
MGDKVESQAGATPPRCDVLLFVATQLELEALREAAVARNLQFEEQKSNIGTFYPLGELGELGGRRVVAVKTQTGGLGPKGSSANARFYVEKTGATSIILVGIAFGVDRRTQKVGDVLVSRQVFPYDDRYVVDQGQGWHYDYANRDVRMFRASTALVTMVEQFLRVPANRDRARLGCLLTGSALVQSAGYRDFLVQRCSAAAKNIIGGEMEAIGLLSLHQRDQCIWLIIKGISDFADGDSSDGLDAGKKLACSNAAKFVLDVLDSWA